jgi:hypothetical protein
VCQPAEQDYRGDASEFCPSRIEIRARSQFEKILTVALNPKLEDLGKAEPDSKSAPDADAPRLCNYGQLEKWLWVELFALGRLFIELFVASARMVLGKQLGKASSPQISYGGVGTNITANFCGRFIDSPPLFPL